MTLQTAFCLVGSLASFSTICHMLYGIYLSTTHMTVPELIEVMDKLPLTYNITKHTIPINNDSSNPK